MFAVQPVIPSTLADVIGQVRDAFDAMGDATPIMIGAQYEAQGVGEPPRVVFVPEKGPGKIGPARELGYVARMTHSCRVTVRGVESGDDIERMRATYALLDRVVACLRRAGDAAVEFGSVKDDSPTDSDAFGAGLSVEFTYARDIPRDPDREALPPATADTSSRAVPPAAALSEGGTVTLAVTPTP